MRVILDPILCKQHQDCIAVAPEVFGQDRFGLTEILDEEPATDLHDRVRHAAAACPRQAILVEG